MEFSWQRERDLPFRENDLEWRRVCKHVVVLSRVSDEITRSRRCLASRREHDRNNDRNRDDGRAIVSSFPNDGSNFLANRRSKRD